MTPQELKNSILQLAIQGKLVEQRPEEGTAEELYQQVQEEKQRLIKAGKIKKEKPLPEISEDEKPFEIPESWKWVRLAEIWSVLNGDRGKNYPAKSTLSNNGIPFISALNLGRNTVITDDNLLCVSEAQYKNLKNGKLQKGDIVVCIRGSLGKHGEYPFDRGAIASSLVILRNYCKTIPLTNLLITYLDSPLFFSEIRKYDNGTAQPNLSAKNLELFLIPLPPLSEQKRIISKIEKLLPYIDRYEQAWTHLEDFNNRSPDDMRKSILQMAIQGKLVEQRPEEGTAEELYQQIQAEKKQLAKAGNLKIEKALSGIAENEKPFEIPESWKWVHFSEIAIFENGDRSKRYPVEADYVDFGIPFFGAKDMQERYLSFDNVRYITQKKYDELGNGKLNDGDFVCLLRGSVGKSAMFVANETHRTGFICAQMVIIRCLIKTISKYIQFYMDSTFYQSCVESKVTGTAVRQLPAKELSKVMIPLPPLAEQKRIVAKLEELLPLCEQLK